MKENERGNDGVEEMIVCGSIMVRTSLAATQIDRTEKTTHGLLLIVSLVFFNALRSYDSPVFSLHPSLS